ncbi:MAG TPA: Gfo/Idh/MocA family oxidoreductase [Myxococcota bacterium]|nr:Gfo/Idh/MocA family oxidoreductase [Myxococcota bacterium]
MRGVAKIAVVGAGYFGSCHCMKIAGLAGARLVAVVDIDGRRAADVAGRHGAESFTSHMDLIGRVDAAVVAVPTSRHHAVAADLLAGGIHLLVEKPLATSVSDAEDLCRLAEERSLKLQVGLLERFNPAVVEAAREIDAPRKIYMQRSGPFLGRGGDSDVVFELMTHDLDILLQLAGAPAKRVAASGRSVCTSHIDEAQAEIEFEDGLLASITASRASTDKVRRFTVEDATGTLEVDLARGSLLRTVDHDGETARKLRQLQGVDALLEQDRAFVEVLQNGRRPAVDGLAGKAAVGLAARILLSIQRGDVC